MDASAAARDSLKTAGLRPTVSRLTILEVLHREPARRHLKATLEQTIVAHGARLSMGTITRTLSELERGGVLACGWTRGGKNIYWLKTTGQATYTHHIVCRRCGRDYSVSDPQLQAQLNKVGNAHGIDISSQQVEIQVVCGDCALTSEML